MARIHCFHMIQPESSGKVRQKCCFCGCVRKQHFDLVVLPGHGEYCYQEVWLYFDTRREYLPYFVPSHQVDVFDKDDLTKSLECIERDLSGNEPALGGDKRGH